VKQWLKGIAKGAMEAECPVTSGEIGDVAEIIKGKDWVAQIQMN